MTPNQQLLQWKMIWYLQAGPAGTGKTYTESLWQLVKLQRKSGKMHYFDSPSRSGENLVFSRRYEGKIRSIHATQL
jgi:hypothetical protein